MPDITMCSSEKCPKKYSCMRSPYSGTQPHALWQSWSNFYEKDKECQHFVEKEDERR